ncbi:hypothetical protein [Marinicellulosiphila megalodicopiae]|uniref:hypothetical protein n=1 Tax=Marinicellulosiphila megalodicopiae TaxID=2724896 RepID=UPI003BB19866
MSIFTFFNKEKTSTSALPEKIYIADQLTYRKDTLKLLLVNYGDFIGSRNLWQLYLSLTITFLITFLTGDQKIIGDLTPQNLFINFGFITSTGFFIYTFYRFISKEDPVKLLESELYTNYINKPDKNSLFIIKRQINNVDQILVFKSNKWNCFFLPYVKISSNDHHSDSKKKIAGYLNYSQEEIIIEMLMDKHETSVKYHPQDNVVKEFHNYYYHLTHTGSNIENDISKKDSFKVGDRNYEWKTLDELEEHELTKEKNKDVLLILRDNIIDFISHSNTFTK